jgi:aromatic-L-amino-acid decarboxylase
MKEAVEPRDKKSRLSSLDISEQALRELSEKATALVLEYFSQVNELRVFPETSSGATVRRLGDQLPVDGDRIERILNDCRAIFDGSRHNGQPRFFGYVASPATAPGAFADLITSTLNANVTAWRSSPAAAEVEQLVVRWLGSLVGFSDAAHGLLTSGGSLANLTAILIAQRSQSEVDISRAGLWNTSPKQTLYASDQIHMSIPKAADILGIGRNQVRLVPTDKNFRISRSSLRRSIQQDLKDGLKPFCIVGSAGTVNTGAVDPLNGIADVAEEFGLWFHVDGAYGAFAFMDERKRKLFNGIERADSLSLDPHKWLYTPIDAGCLLLRDESRARKAFSANEADYIKIHEQNKEESFAFWDYGVELSRRFRALKIWMTLRYFGSRRIAAAIAEDIALAHYLAKQITAAEDFELLAPVELSICCFRYLPKKFRKTSANSGAEATLDEINTRLMQAVQRSGDAYLSNATVNGKFALRACITNFRTTRADIDLTLDVIRKTAVSLKVG